MSSRKHALEKPFRRRSSWKHVASIADEISACGVARRIRGEVEEGSLELVYLSLPSKHVSARANEKQHGTYPIGILSRHMFFVSIGMKSEISVAI